MGKRKRRDDPIKTPPPPPPPSDIMPCSSGLDILSKEKSSLSVDCGAVKPVSSIMDIMDGSIKLPNAQLPLSHHHHNLSGSVLFRHPRRFYGRKYSRRNSANNADASTSQGRDDPLHDKKNSSNLACHNNSYFGRDTESKEQPFPRPEKTRTSFSAIGAVSHGVVRTVCGLCQKLLRRKPNILGTTPSESDASVSVVAVLVCGHTYHAECLEDRTSHEDRWDPPCPLCVAPSLAI